MTYSRRADRGLKLVNARQEVYSVEAARACFMSLLDSIRSVHADGLTPAKSNLALRAACRDLHTPPRYAAPSDDELKRLVAAYERQVGVACKRNKPMYLAVVYRAHGNGLFPLLQRLRKEAGYPDGDDIELLHLAHHVPHGAEW
jgi:hypothetical protein